MSPLYLSLLIGALVLAYGIYVYLPINRAIRETKVLMHAAVTYEQHPQSPTMRILVIGDSTALGTGATPETSIAGRLGALYPNAEIVNDAENGRKLDEFLKRIHARKDERYDLILFQIGGNDIVMLTSEQKIRERLSASLDIAETMAPKIVVMSAGNVGLAPVFKWPLSSLYTHRARSIRDLYKDVMNSYSTATYINLFNERENEPFNNDIDRYYAPDHFHPSGDGYGLWFEKLEKVL